MSVTGSRPRRADELSPRSPRIVAARRLSRRRHRDEAGLFLVEGPRAVREAVSAGHVRQLFAGSDGYGRSRDLIDAAHDAGASVWPVTEQALASLTDTVTPQGIVAVCDQCHVEDIGAALDGEPALVVVLAGVADPGNAGTVLRTADAAGAGAVVFPAGSVDAYNAKCVRASAGSVFHLDLVRGGSAHDTLKAVRAAGLRIFAADAHGSTDLDELADAGALAARTAWVFGSEAHGLPAELAALADATVRVPMRGRAESLNLAAAAAICLYATARAHRRPGAPQ